MKKIVAILLFAVTLFSADIKLATEDFNNENYKEAFAKFHQIANDGVVAKYYMGHMYEFGLGVKKDIKRAASFYKMSADDGFDVAQNDIGNAYLKGLGVEKSIKNAIYYYQLASKQGNKQAIETLKNIQTYVKKSNNFAYLTIKSNKYDDKVYVNGKYMGSTKITLLLEPNKTYDIEIRKVGFKNYKFQKVKMKPLEQRTIIAYLKQKL